MSNVLMEASACGRPVIATRIDGCREIFEDGVTGFGCEPKNAKSLEGAIRRFLALPSEERAKMGAAARAKMEREFDRRKVTEAYMEEVRNILG
jgi:galacturonosyltransferase